MRGRPALHTNYASDSSILPSVTKRVALGAFIALFIFTVLGDVPGLRFFGEGEWGFVWAQCLVFGIGALGLNILTGLGGQVSLGHAFFLGIGAYTAAVLGGKGSGSLWGMELPIWVWLPASGLVAAFFGSIISPIAVRLRGLYLAIVTLGLVFLGEHLFRNITSVAGSPGVGRDWPTLDVRVWKENKPLLDLSTDSSWFGVGVTAQQKKVVALLVVLVVLGLLARNIARTRIGRALQAIRDRDIAAEVMGVAEAKTKLIAFGISSFYAGVAGALFAAIYGTITPDTWNLAMSVEFVAILIIGGAGTITGTLMGTFIVVASTQYIRDLSESLTNSASGDGLFQPISDLIISRGGDFGFISLETTGKGLSIFQFNQLFYGLLLVVFMLFEPLGLYGIWAKIRGYWKSWPFTY